MDSLGGILIKGLLGNPILARFSLFLDIVIEDVTPTPTPQPSYTITPTVTIGPTVTPTPTPIPIHVGGGGGRYPDVASDEKLVKVTITYKGKSHVSIHKVNNKTLKISINILKGITYVKDKAYSVAVNIREGIKNIKVKINGDGNRD